MHIGIDASNLRSGGGITHIVELLAHGDPAKHGIDGVTVWASATSMERIPLRPWLKRITVQELEGWLPRRVAWQLFQRSRLAEAECDVVFAPGATPAGRFRPYVSMSTNMLPFASGELRRYGWSGVRLRLMILRRQQLAAFRTSNAVIFLTDYARERISTIAGLNGNSRVAVIPSGVNERFLLEPRPARPLSSYTSDDPFRFLYVSDIHPYKHHANVARAVVRLHDEGLPVALDIIGYPASGSSMARLDNAISQSAPGIPIRYFGPVPHDLLPEIYQQAGAFVFASTCENLPMTLVEAMASGLPIAASNARPMPDILGEGSVLFDAESVPSIADALRRLANDHELRDRIAIHGHESAMRYSWKECADRTFALLASVAREQQHA